MPRRGSGMRHWTSRTATVIDRGWFVSVFSAGVRGVAEALRGAREGKEEGWKGKST